MAVMLVQEHRSHEHALNDMSLRASKASVAISVETMRLLLGDSQ